MIYNFTPFKQATKETEEWLKREFSSIRTGRATPAILDGIKVEAYGGEMAVMELGNISVEDARMMRITPWDMSVAKDIEKAIATSDLGLSVALDDKGLRVTFPELTSDRRTALLKVAKGKLEDARVALRGEREKTLKDIDAKEKEGGMSEDEKFRFKAELQKYVDEVGKNFDDLLVKKEKEIAE